MVGVATELKHPLALVLIVIVTCSTDVLAEDSDYGVLVDYESVHGLLIERCRQAFPDSAPALQTAITEWQRKNGEPLGELRRMVQKLVRTPQDGAHLNRLTSMLTNGFKEQVAKWPMTELEKQCTGSYAVALQSAGFDFETLLKKWQSERKDMVRHSFSFDTFTDSPDAEVLDYQYGGSGQFGTHANKEMVQLEKVFRQWNTSGVMPRGEFLYVKWRLKPSGEVHEDKVDLTARLPADITGYRIHFVIKGAQLYVYLISPETDRRPASSPAGPLRRYSDLKQHQIYPDQAK